ncbi:hypothetical protein GCM10027515_03760 [Schumannella luteola]|uniref:Asp23/Gls24 family envelope stress response protein n=1 Tax=Schumannella luteola TaxID=472059 RepID=A0A852YL70_9MICO|nr:hypothetical protein [Schumannella luteola]NYG98489.1 hypothetical protein [Schumannella luteola]TPX01285.1 hypothetical protein FJ656_28250 [Schumannella luteola]
MSDRTSPAAPAGDGDASAAGELGFAIDAAVLAAPGVQRLFPTDPAALRALQQVAGDGVARPASALRSGSVAISVAIDDTRPTRELCDELTARVRAIAGPVRVEIRVSRIHTDRI